MVSTVERKHWTVADYMALPDDGKRYEVIDGELFVTPDVFVVPLVGGARPRQWKDITSLLLGVEILSPSTARTDRTVKRRRYQRAGVGEYWMVDGDARLVERWRPDDERPEILADELVWQPDSAHEPLRLDLHAFFASALDG